MDIEQAIVPIESITQSIIVLRGQRVILDSELARLYGVTTKRLNEQVKRNAERFPSDFTFQVTQDEYAALMLQNATSKPGRGGVRKLPYAFTEHGALMAASVLNSPRAVEVSVYVVRAFVRLRALLSAHTDLAEKLAELEERLEARLDAHDDQIGLLMEAIRQLMLPPTEEEQRRIGFRAECLESSIPIT